MSKTVELGITSLHLVVLRVENDTLLDLLHVSLVKNIISNRQFFNSKVVFE